MCKKHIYQTFWTCFVWIEKGSFRLDPEERKVVKHTVTYIAAATLQQIRCTNTSAIKAQKPGGEPANSIKTTWDF